MSGTLGRLRFYQWCDLSSLETDYAPPLQDYPDYPRQMSVDMYADDYKSALGSNWWRYVRGTSASWKFDWVDVSDDAQATMGIIVASSFMYSPHIAIFESNGIDSIGLGSLLADVTPIGTYFVQQTAWEPRETQYGLWSFSVTFRQEA